MNNTNDDALIGELKMFTGSMLVGNETVWPVCSDDEWGEIIALIRSKENDGWRDKLLDKANARLSSAMAQSAQAKSSEYEATQEGRIRELHWLIDELDLPQPPIEKEGE